MGSAAGPYGPFDAHNDSTLGRRRISVQPVSLQGSQGRRVNDAVDWTQLSTSTDSRTPIRRAEISVSTTQLWSGRACPCPGPTTRRSKDRREVRAAPTHDDEAPEDALAQRESLKRSRGLKPRTRADGARSQIPDHGGTPPELRNPNTFAVADCVCCCCGGLDRVGCCSAVTELCRRAVGRMSSGAATRHTVGGNAITASLSSWQ